MQTGCAGPNAGRGRAIPIDDARRALDQKIQALGRQIQTAIADLQRFRQENDIDAVAQDWPVQTAAMEKLKSDLADAAANMKAATNIAENVRRQFAAAPASAPADDGLGPITLTDEDAGIRRLTVEKARLMQLRDDAAAKGQAVKQLDDQVAAADKAMEDIRRKAAADQWRRVLDNAESYSQSAKARYACVATQRDALQKKLDAMEALLAAQHNRELQLDELLRTMTALKNERSAMSHQ